MNTPLRCHQNQFVASKWITESPEIIISEKLDDIYTYSLINFLQRKRIN